MPRPVDPRLAEHVEVEDAVAFLRGDFDEDELLRAPSIEDREQRPLLWWQRDDPHERP